MYVTVYILLHTLTSYIKIVIYEPFVTPYMEEVPETIPDTEEMNTIFPYPEALSKGCASWEIW